MLDYDEINKRMDEKMPKEEPKKEEKYIGSLLFLLHICLMSGMIWIGVKVSVTLVWFSIIGYGLFFLVSVTVYNNGHEGKAVLMTLGSIFAGILFLFSKLISILASAH